MIVTWPHLAAIASEVMCQLRCIGVARILSGGALFFDKKVDPFSAVALKIHAKTNLSHRLYPPISSKNRTLALPLGGALSVWGVHLQLSPVNLAQKKISPP